MKKGLKLGVIALSVLALAGTILSTNAQNSNTYEARLVINEGEFACTGYDYDFGAYDASATDQLTIQVTHPVNCILLDNDESDIQYQLQNLSNGTDTIAASQFSINQLSSETTVVGISGGTVHNNVWMDAGAGITMFEKPANTLGTVDFSGTNTVAMTGTIPGGQAAGTYTGALNLSW